MSPMVWGFIANRRKGRQSPLERILGRKQDWASWISGAPVKALDLYEFHEWFSAGLCVAPDRDGGKAGATPGERVGIGDLIGKE